MSNLCSQPVLTAVTTPYCHAAARLLVATKPHRNYWRPRLRLRSGHAPQLHSSIRCSGNRFSGSCIRRGDCHRGKHSMRRPPPYEEDAFSRGQQLPRFLISLRIHLTGGSPRVPGIRTPLKGVVRNDAMGKDAMGKDSEEKMRRQGNGRPLLRLSGLALSGEPGLLQPLPGYAMHALPVSSRRCDRLGVRNPRSLPNL